MKVKCIKNSIESQNYLHNHITLNKTYEVLREGFMEYYIINDINLRQYYPKELFEKEMKAGQEFKDFKINQRYKYKIETAGIVTYVCKDYFHFKFDDTGYEKAFCNNPQRDQYNFKDLIYEEKEMKVIYNSTGIIGLTSGKVYDVLDEDETDYRVKDDFGYRSWGKKHLFKIVKEEKEMDNKNIEEILNVLKVNAEKNMPTAESKLKLLEEFVLQNSLGE